MQRFVLSISRWRDARVSVGLVSTHVTLASQLLFHPDRRVRQSLHLNVEVIKDESLRHSRRPDASSQLSVTDNLKSGATLRPKEQVAVSSS